MGRHNRPGPSEQSHPRRIALAVRHTIPAPVADGTTAPPGLDVTTLTIRPIGPAAALNGVAPLPVERRPDSPVPPTGPPERLGRRARRAARQEQEDRAALAARIARANRRNRQVAASGVPAPRSADPSSISGPLSIDALGAARPPWSGGSLARS